MKTIALVISSLASFILMTGCIQNEAEIQTGVIGAKEPEFEGAPQPEAVTASSIRVSATVSKENGYKITERGFIYGTSSPPNEDSEAKKIVDTGMDVEQRIGKYTLTMEGLSNNTQYYIQPYAINTIGTGFGSVLSRNTNEGIASISTIEPEVVRASSAITGVVITFTGEGEILKAGVCYYEKGHSEQTDTFIYVTSYPYSATQGDSLKCHLQGLKPDTEYEVKAFLENTYGSTLGELFSLQTQDGRPMIVNSAINEQKYTEVTLTATVTNGGDETVLIGSCGFCWAISTETTNPNLSNHVVSCNADNNGYFSGTITGLTSNTLYYARAYAISDLGIIVYGEDVIPFRTISNIPTVITDEEIIRDGGNAFVKGIIYNEGEYPVTDWGFCWSRSNPYPGIDTDSVLHLTTRIDSSFSGQLARLRGGITYNVRAYATNANGTGYGEVISFQTPPIFATGLQEFGGEIRHPNTLAYFSIGQYLYILGGDLGPNCTNELYRYSITLNSWDQMLAFTGGPSKWQYGVTYGNGAYVYGGFNSNGNETPGIYYYDPNQNRWFYYEGPDSTIVYQTLGFARSNDIYFVGGHSGDTVRQDVWNFNHPDKLWHKKTDFPVKQYGGVAAVIDNVAYVGFGRDENDECNRTLWATSDAADTWDFISYCNEISGYVVGGVACQGRLYVVDQIENEFSILEYNPVTDEWIRKSWFPSGHKAFHCIYMVNNKIYIGLGGSRLFMVYDPLWDNE